MGSDGREHDRSVVPVEVGVRCMGVIRCAYTCVGVGDKCVIAGLLMKRCPQCVCGGGVKTRKHKVEYKDQVDYGGRGREEVN